ncbi:MAG: undecaprenyldiphospho-muramoylpentapeptide beta-N-acetylglucosaminyltransferase [Bacteroidia bacterium]|nr:undecaprenyldiphospho-muramoylpentapeptide beta-N-acetylglucosaminyltransferase [Bacteroidia bacterium]
MSVPLKFIFSGGGTGGHIFPAIAIANAIREKRPDAEILFIGALGRMEMEKVPASGYRIEGLPIAGFQRKKIWKNWNLLFKLMASMGRARQIIKDFSPDAVIGTGGYASAPTLRVAAARGIPTLIQEQNSFPGVTNKLLASKVNRICVAFRGMEKYFPREKILITGNPVRKDIVDLKSKKEEAIGYFHLAKDRPVLLVIGGSLGAGTINGAMLRGIRELEEAGMQVIWQTGKNQEKEMASALQQFGHTNIHLSAFIQRMDLAYAAADLVISRAGAISVSEICVAGKACILVPSPNVAEDHQTKNAIALVNENAAQMISDRDAGTGLIHLILDLMKNQEARNQLAQNALRLSLPNAAALIADEIISMVKKR